MISALPVLLVQVRRRKPLGEKVARSWPDVRRADELDLWEQICGPEENRAHHFAGQRALQTQMVMNMIEASFLQ